MPRYHFDLVDSKTVADEGGADLPDDIAATDAADLIAKRLLVECPKLKNKDFAIRFRTKTATKCAASPSTLSTDIRQPPRLDLCGKSQRINAVWSRL